MDLLAIVSDDEVTNFGWVIGSLSGVVFDIAVIVAITMTPRLREHGAAPAPPGFPERWLGKISALLIVILWAVGVCYTGLEQLPRYALNTAGAAAAMIGMLMLTLLPLAAMQIARRSVW
ncbi:MAG: hypothetical protein JO358_05600 [Alphaproteobacteria bacterium]|nr:hypothetical protein [Alphaproteobacteria bacterium]